MITVRLLYSPRRARAASGPVQMSGYSFGAGTDAPLPAARHARRHVSEICPPGEGMQLQFVRLGLAACPAVPLLVVIFSAFIRLVVQARPGAPRP